MPKDIKDQNPADISDIKLPSKEELLAGEIEDDPISTDDDVDDSSDDEYEDDPPPADDEIVDDEEQRILEEAIAQGYNPDYDGPDARSPKEFLERGSFFKKIGDLNSSVKSLRTELSKKDKQIEFLMKRAKAADQVARESAIDNLRAQKQEALEQGDHALVIKLDDQIMDARLAARNEEEIDDDEVDDPSKQEPDPEVVKQYEQDFSAFKSRNTWYTKSKLLHDLAEQEGARYIDANPNYNPQDVLKHVENFIKERYSDEVSRFSRKSGKDRANSVEGGKHRRNRGGRPKHTIADLSPDEVRIMRNMMASSGIESEEEYIQGLEQSGYFK